MSCAFIRLALATSLAIALSPCAGAAQATMDYVADSDWAKLPDGREWGAVTGVYPDPDGRHVWVLDRCGANSCLDSELSPVFKFDLEGNLVANFGAGLFAWPHGFYVDRQGNVWVTDGGTGARAEEAARHGLGHQVLKLSPSGQVLLRLGRAAVAGAGPDTFDGPSEVLVAPSGDIYVVDGHGEGGNNRVVRFAPDGRFVQAWGTSGPGPAAGELNDPHALAMDSQGRLFVGDRRNARIQIFDEDGTFLEHWTQFGPPSSIYIDANDLIYVTDTQTAAMPGWFAERRPSSWVRGIRIGDARTGRVTGFLPSDAEFVAADGEGNVYGAEVPGERLTRYSPAAR
ncbi:MAG: peptidyl-alpha-hydroxyglycine alpha-amidating lyase family protein [Gemmatimonadota bacterium]